MAKLHITLILLVATTVFSCAQQPDNQVANATKQATVTSGAIEKVVKTENEWKAQLTPKQYNILREQGTEYAFSGEYWNHKEKGVYTCAACNLPLFSSETKFRSGTGWPSYYEPIAPANVGVHDDKSYGMVRTEVRCARCDGHLGHIFNDGPKPTGLRYCINSASLSFQTE